MIWKKINKKFKFLSIRKNDLQHISFSAKRIVVCDEIIEVGKE